MKDLKFFLLRHVKDISALQKPLFNKYHVKNSLKIRVRKGSGSFFPSDIFKWIDFKLFIYSLFFSFLLNNILNLNDFISLNDLKKYTVYYDKLQSMGLF